PAIKCSTSMNAATATTKATAQKLAAGRPGSFMDGTAACAQGAHPRCRGDGHPCPMGMRDLAIPRWA
ncbi:MAG: hypothetical protein M0Z68_12520, partial [Gammaproteobacteria bacterium]|nr:hypothetical protein [Gammaproteobacteria bacterium]